MNKQETLLILKRIKDNSFMCSMNLKTYTLDEFKKKLAEIEKLTDSLIINIEEKLK